MHITKEIFVAHVDKLLKSTNNIKEQNKKRILMGNSQKIVHEALICIWMMWNVTNHQEI